MKALRADWLLTMDDEQKFIRDGAVVFDDNIIFTGTFAEAKQKYSYLEFEDCGLNSVIMPALINPHTHLEFSRNKTDLHYGEFLSWLQSVINKREGLLSDDGLELVIEGLLSKMLRYGVASLGAISSLGKDFMPCVGAKQKIVYFNEILGTKPERFELSWNDFKARLARSERFAGTKFKPAISIHSPYSTHPDLINSTLDVAKSDSLLTATHFLESRGERKWLEGSRGEFKIFFKQNFGLDKSFQTQMEFLEKFGNVDAMFIHCVYANSEELQFIKSINGSVVHCPVSNRLLGGKYFDVELAKNLGIEYSIGTDGLSSNFSLNPMREIRHALFGYLDLNLQLLGYDLLKAVTLNAAKALRLNSGILKEGYAADIISFELPGIVEDESELALQIILHTDEVKQIFIDGEIC